MSVGKRCSIGPFARLRSGVAIADDARIGNFTELVRTKVATRVRMNHVSYLGDAIVEEDVNIGAGTITANYDGKEKHQTHIGKGAFIGSDTVLIAPVKVGAGAVTGAGSVVTHGHDVPAKGMVAGVPARALNHRDDGHAAAAPKPVARVKVAQAAPKPKKRVVQQKVRAARKKPAAAARRRIVTPKRKARPARKLQHARR